MQQDDMPPDGWILCCTREEKDGTEEMKGKVMSREGKHCYEVFLDSPIGQALKKVTRKKDQKYVLLSDVEGYKDMNAFKEIESPGFHNLLNVGKEWVFRDIFSTGCEVVSNKTGATMQSFQTRLKRLDLQGLGLKHPVFQIVTHVTGCRGGKCYAFDVLNHFHLVREGDIEALVKGGIVYKENARRDFLEDMKAVLGNPDTFAKLGFEIKEINAEAGYPHSEEKEMMVGIEGFTF